MSPCIVGLTTQDPYIHKEHTLRLTVGRKISYGLKVNRRKSNWKRFYRQPSQNLKSPESYILLTVLLLSKVTPLN